MIRVFGLKPGNRLQRKDTYFQYSANEQFTGEYWTNGKKIYQKVLVISQSSISSSTAVLSHNIANVDHIIDFVFKFDDCTYGYPRTRILPSSYFRDVSGWAGQVIPSREFLHFELGDAIYERIMDATTQNIEAIIKYTKTTD